jgi:hypothetical protein
MLPQITKMIKPACLQIGVRRGDFGKGGFCQDIGGDVLDCGIGDLVNEADIAVFAGGDARALPGAACLIRGTVFLKIRNKSTSKF